MGREREVNLFWQRRLKKKKISLFSLLESSSRGGQWVVELIDDGIELEMLGGERRRVGTVIV